jgi:hypothetical protein
LNDADDISSMLPGAGTGKTTSHEPEPEQLLSFADILVIFGCASECGSPSAAADHTVAPLSPRVVANGASFSRISLT